MIGSAFYTYSFEQKDCHDDKVLFVCKYQAPARPTIHTATFLFPKKMGSDRMKRAAQAYAECRNSISPEQKKFLMDHMVKS